MKILYKHKRKIAAFLLVVFISDLVSPTISWALTGGPSQPEVQSFEPVQTVQMVDKPTGDFTYNIPLMDVGGYPINISYHSGISMDQEASWVGLGWNINPGVINRQMRGLPDDFSGDSIEKEYNIRTNYTVGVELGVGVSFVEFPIGLGANAGVYYNNYKGVGFKAGTSFSFSMAVSSNQKDNKTSGLGVNLSLGLSFDSQNGIGVMPNVGLSLSSTEQTQNLQSSTSVGLNAGVSYNSRSGLGQMTFGLSVSQSVSQTKKAKGKDGKEYDKRTGNAFAQSITRSSSISFASQPVTPTIQFPMQNFGFTGNFQIGGFTPLYTGEINISGNITGYYSHQKLVKKQETLPGYGYMYMQDANQDSHALLDFNREKDQPFRKPSKKKKDEGTPILAIPSAQYDLLGVSGQGISGQYRSMRNDFGSIYDHEVSSWSGSGSIGIDIALGSYCSIGVDVNASVSNTATHQWKQGNELFDDLKFYGHDNTLFEPAPFINIGEKTIDDQSFYDALGDVDPIRIELGGSPFIRTARRVFTAFKNGVQNGAEQSLNVFKKKQRSKRNQVMSFITAAEAAVSFPNSPSESITLDREIHNYQLNNYVIDQCNDPNAGSSPINRLDHSRGRRSHISELTVLNADGQRYVYGIPAYNRVQKDVTFNVDTTQGNTSTGMVGYNSGGPHPDNSRENNQGLDHFFSRETMPGYAHSYLLTAILSPDYVDLTGDGVTDDDMGTAVRINYSRVHGNSSNDIYHWRIPYNQNEANYQEGFKTDNKDDKGNYTYGEKELWYVHSIVSKTMVALFKCSKREDGLGVLGENGGKNFNDTLLKLDRIELFSKSDLITYGQNAVPIKIVHFEYSYNLCPGVDNNSLHPVDVNGQNPSNTGLPDVNNKHGKLTLERMYFTYQKNTKGKLNPYVFHYASYNPFYNLKKYDRWGNYKSNTGNVAANEVEFPYTLQKKDSTDLYASAWSVNKIDLPTGGTININYESDDYAYVQNKRAGQMFEIVGLNSNSGLSTSNKLYTANFPSFNDSTDHNNYLFFRTVTPINSRQDVFDRYLEGINYVFYRCAVKMYTEHDPSRAEYVPGYCKIANFGICNDHNYFWIKLKPESVGNSGAEVTNPITKSAWQFMRMNLAKLAYPGSENDPNDFASVIKSLIAPLFDLQNIFMGFSRACMTKKWCEEIVLDRSWVRLNNPTFSKLGGGLRVKSLTISDQWSQMVNGETSAEYGQVYDYTMPGAHGPISSGVAEYEPLMGGDENPFRQPLQFKERTKLAPHSQFYIEYPLGETFFPAANVVYRQVKVSSYGSTLVAPEKRTGYTLNKYYTAYDFPIFTDCTPMERYPDKIPSFFQIFQVPNIEHFTGSQGFQIELNDMHGKPLSEEVYGNDDHLISSTTYKYFLQNPSAPVKKVKNEVTVMMPDGTIKNNVPVGKSVELMTDFRHQATHQGSLGALITVDLSSIIPPIPVAIPTVYPSISYENTQFRSAVTTKVVRRFGILASTTAKQYGSTVTTENKVFDSETGEVLLTETKNEFNDPIYNYTYPAHLAYEGMGPAYKNVDAEFKDVSFSNGHIVHPTSIINYFTEGDEVLIYHGLFGEKLWVINPHHLDNNISSQKIFVDRNGVPFNSNGMNNGLWKVKIIRSGRRNLSTLPIASVVSLQLPLHNDTIVPYQTDEIINTSVTEYKDEWKIRCDKITTAEYDHCNTPSCECMYNLLKYISDNHLWMKTAADSVFVNGCCLDSCFYTDGTYSNLNCTGCKRQFYAIGNDSFPGNGHIINVGYKAVVGRCTLEVRQVPGASYNQPVTQLIVPSPESNSVNDTGCVDVCSDYNKNGAYPLRGRRLLNFSQNFEAVLICPPIYKLECIDLNEGKQVNPYKVGLLGNWRPEKQWVYRGLRTPGSINSTGQTDIRHDGTFETYSPFWDYDAGEQKFVKSHSLSSKYIDATTITKYNFKGAEIENRDAAGIYSSALFGYLESQAIAVAKNARYKNIAFDPFEDYTYKTDCSEPCRTDHFNFREKLEDGCLAHCAEIDSTESHTGNTSLKVLGSGAGSVGMQRDLLEDNEGSGLLYDANSSSYKLKREGCLPKFSPDTGKYFVSAWVKEVQNCTALHYDNAKIRFSYDGSPQVDELTPTGNIIEGWQRIEGTINVPPGATTIKVELFALNGVSVNYDDVRIQPFNSSMKGYVYDVRTLRLMAELDENNYAAFYEYDDEGALIRVKKETEKGIMTIQENRSVLKKQ